MQQAVIEGGKEYVPFGNVDARNGLQERIEIPLIIGGQEIRTRARPEHCQVAARAGR